MGDSLLGAEMAEALGLERGKAREVARRLLLAIDQFGRRRREMISGAHVMIFTQDEAADRAFLRDVLEIPCIDSGGGWLIFRLPPAELGVHRGDNGFHQIYFICDDVDAFVARWRRRASPRDPDLGRGLGPQHRRHPARRRQARHLPGHPRPAVGISRAR